MGLGEGRDVREICPALRLAFQRQTLFLLSTRGIKLYLTRGL